MGDHLGPNASSDQRRLAIAYKAVYESTPYAIEAISNPSKIAEAAQARSAAFVGS
jgi:hypothetical protein